MVKNSGRNPFTLSDPVHKLAAFPRPFTRKADQDIGNQYFSLAPGSDPFSSQEDYTVVAGSVGQANQAWITNWIYSTGDNMENQQVSYFTHGSHGPQWKKSPSPTGTGSSSSHTYADDAYSVEPSSAGFDTLEFTPISSPDTGRSFVPTESVAGSTFQAPLDDTAVSQEHMNDTFSMFQDDDISVFAQQSQIMLPHSDMMDPRSLETTVAEYGERTLDLKLDIPGSTVPTLGRSHLSSISTDNHFQAHYSGHTLGQSAAEHFHPSMASGSEFLPHDAIADGVPLTSIPWVPNHSAMMTPSLYDNLANSLTHLGFTTNNLQSEEMMSFFRTSETGRKTPLRIAPRPAHPEDEPQMTGRETEEQKALVQKTKKNQLPRTDPLYQAKPDKDGYYRCPYIEAGEKGCKEGKHKPTKQKCTYDKYLDAHIKPYRCKHSGCENESFSSNAVLGRHLREMHDRSSSPLCRFPDCKRGQPGCGFRRQYNCWDHERRVHKLDIPYTGTDRPSNRKRAKGAKAKSIGMKKSGSSQSAMTARSDPENRSATVFPEAPDGVPRRQSFPSAEEVIRTPTTAFGDQDLEDEEAFSYDLGDDNSLDQDEWFAAYYNPDMDAEDDY